MYLDSEKTTHLEVFKSQGVDLILFTVGNTFEKISVMNQFITVYQIA